MPQNVPGKKPARNADTILESVEPLTPAERQELDNELFHAWALKSLDKLLQYAEGNRGFGEYMCRRIDERLGEDTHLSAVLRSRLRVGQQGQKRGRKSEWDDGRYAVLSAEYEALKSSGMGREEVLMFLAPIYAKRYSTSISASYLGRKLTAGRKLLRGTAGGSH